MGINLTFDKVINDSILMDINGRFDHETRIYYGS